MATIAVLRGSTRLRLPHVLVRTGMFLFEQKRHRHCQYIRGQRRRSFQSSNEVNSHAGSAQRIHYRKFGGLWRAVVSDTAQAKSAKSTSFVYALDFSFKQGALPRFYLGTEHKKVSITA
jgi:hypothetical protein